MHAVPKNLNLVSVQKAHIAVRTCKEPCFMQRRIGPKVKICGKSGLPIAMVPCLLQWNVFIKGKLRVCSAEKNVILFRCKKSTSQFGPAKNLDPCSGV